MSRTKAVPPTAQATQVLDAGGLLPVGTKPPAGERVDTVVARGYRHPVLGDRVVVRLTAEAVAAGDDLEMETLGFGAAEPRGAVGLERTRPLGFPGWALVHDPKHARYALDVVREFKKEARRAKSKPGFAKEGIDKIGERLGKSVPHFLPAFYEEAGRAFIEHGALSFAAMMFGKAREAEAVHALDTDETHRAHAFLEFALAGAVTTKALAQYAKELGEHQDAATAYALFRELCVKRTLGGMPPWGGMAKELRRLAKAAGKDPDAEDAGFLAEVIDSPALVNAAGEFWRGYAAPIQALAQTTPAIRGALLDLWPTPSPANPAFDAEWIGMLDAAGALRALEHDGEPAEALPPGGRAAWFDKLVAHTSRHWRDRVPPIEVFAVLRRIAPRLVADGVAITCVRRWGQVDVDLAELALELGVPIAIAGGPRPSRIDLEDWAEEATRPERGRDPVRVAAHPALGPLVVASVANEIGEEPFDSVARGKTGLAAAKRAWLEGVIAAAEAGGLPAIDDALETVEKRVTAATFAELPDLHARFAAIDVAAALARTLRGGLVDELGWPALEAADRELDPDNKGLVHLTGAFPTLVVHNKLRAIALGAAGRLGEHDFQLPKDAAIHACRWVQGQFLVLYTHDRKSHGYWSSSPGNPFELEGSLYGFAVLGLRSVVLPDGAVCEGAAAYRAGDRGLPIERMTPPLSDGTTIWRQEYKDTEYKLREVSPTTGDLGRFSWPAFLEAYITEGWSLHVGSCSLQPAPGLRSPLGQANGLLGVRARVKLDAHRRWDDYQLETIDGATWHGAAGGGHPVELLAIPGDDRRRPLVVESAWRSLGSTSICDPTGAYQACVVSYEKRGYSRGTPVILPAAAWHHLVPRDPGGSIALRAATEAQARAMIATVDTGGRAAAALADLVATPDAVRASVPTVAEPLLVAGIAGVVGLARRFEVARDELVAARDPAQASALPSVKLDDEKLRDVLGGGYRWGSARGSVAAQITAVGAALFAGPDAGDVVIADVAESSLDWAPWALTPGALIYSAQAFGYDAATQRELARLVELLLQAGFIAAGGALRLWRGSGPKESVPGLDATADAAVIRRGGNGYFVRKQRVYPNIEYLVLEHAAAGAFKPLGGLAVQWERRGVPGSEDAVRGFLARAASGAAGWSADAAAAVAAATGLTTGEAALAWAGFPRLANTSAGFLPKEQREAMELKSQQAAAARDSLRTVDDARRLEILAAAAADPIALWDPVAGGAAARFAEAWNRLVGKRTPIPDEILVAADRELQTPMQPAAALAMVGNPNASAKLTIDATHAFDHKGQLVRVPPGTTELVVAAGLDDDDAPAAVDLPALTTAAVYLPWLFATLPVGDPLRAQLPIAHALANQRLDHPGLWLTQAGNSHYGPAEESERAIAAALDAFGGDELAAPVVGRIHPGGAVVRSDRTVTLHLRPSQLHDATELARMRLHTASYQRWDVGTRDVIAYLRSDELARMMKRVTETPVPAGGWEQNPLASAPGLVARVSKARGVSAEAAALYLQMLALLWPTPKNVQIWNGWTPGVYKKAIAELEAKELVLEAKRERAQRSYFLPGGWEALKAPHPPMETWKVPLYTDDRGPTGDPKPRFMRFFAFDAPHVLFELAWERVEAGDPPRYEEVAKR